MFGTIMRTHMTNPAQNDEFFRRFKSTPGLIHAYELTAVDGADELDVVGIWESREDAERYLRESKIPQEVAATFASVTRSGFEVRDSK